MKSRNYPWPVALWGLAALLAVGPLAAAPGDAPEMPPPAQPEAKPPTQEGDSTQPATPADANKDPKTAADDRRRPPRDTFQQGVQLVNQGKLEEAAEKFRAVIQRNPRDAASHSWLGYTYLQLKRPDDALSTLQQAQKLQPRNAEIVNNIGNARMAREEYELAVEAYKQAIQMRRQHEKKEYGDAWYNLGFAHTRLSQWPQAVEAYEKATTLLPKDANVLNNLAYAQEKVRQDAIALENYEKATNLAPDKPLFWYNYGLALRKGMRLADAERALARAVRLEADNASYNLALADVLTAQVESVPPAEREAKLEAAATALSRATALSPEDFTAQYNLGLLQTRRERYGLAEESLLRATDLQKESPDAWFGLGYARLKQNKMPAAEEAFRKALELRPNWPEALRNLGLTLEAQQKQEEALTIWQRAAAANTQDAEVRMMLAGHYLRNARWNDAVPLYRDVVRIDPQSYVSWANLGFALDKANKPTESLSAYQNSVKVNPRYSLAWNNMGAVLERLGRTPEAVTAYRKALEIDPSYKDAADNLKRLNAPPRTTPASRPASTAAAPAARRGTTTRPATNNARPRPGTRRNAGGRGSRTRR
jgi:Flp pilus assembly protein TadD